MTKIVLKTPVQQQYNLEPLGEVEVGYTGEHGEKRAYVHLPRYGVSMVLSADEAQTLADALLKIVPELETVGV